MLPTYKVDPAALVKRAGRSGRVKRFVLSLLWRLEFASIAENPPVVIRAVDQRTDLGRDLSGRYLWRCALLVPRLPNLAKAAYRELPARL